MERVQLGEGLEDYLKAEKCVSHESRCRAQKILCEGRRKAPLPSKPKFKQDDRGRHDTESSAGRCSQLEGKMWYIRNLRLLG